MSAAPTTETAAEHGAPDHGGGHGAHGFSGKTFTFQMLNFVLLAALLARFAGRAINKALAARHEQMKADLEEARRLREAAEARIAAHDRRIANLEQEVTALRAGMRSDAEDEKRRVLAGAEEKAKRLQAETEFQVAQLVRDAELRLRADVARAALAAAEALVSRDVNAGDDQRLARGFVAELAAPAPEARG